MKVSTYQILFCILLLASCHSGVKQKNCVYDYATLIPETSPLNEDGVNENFNRVFVDASVYAGLMQMLGVGDYCLDFSKEMQPSIEKIAEANPQLLLVSAYDGADYSKYKKLNVPIVECRDFLEPTALGRAEWMRYLGRLFGVRERADSLFKVVEQEYQTLCDSTSSTRSLLPIKGEVPEGRRGAIVFFDMIYSGIWYQPSPKSTIGQIVTDAGGSIPFTTDQEGGSLALSEEKVLLEAENADFWLIRAMNAENMTLASLAEMAPVYSRFKAFKTGNVFVCDTQKTPFYEETPFRPDWLLREFRNIFQGNTDDLRYFRKLE